MTLLFFKVFRGVVFTRCLPDIIHHGAIDTRILSNIQMHDVESKYANLVQPWLNFVFSDDRVTGCPQAVANDSHVTM